MADATRHDEVVEVVTPAHVTLTLTIEEAVVLRTVGLRVGGNTSHWTGAGEPTPRELFDNIKKALDSVGVRPMTDGNKKTSGSVYLADNEGRFPDFLDRP
jgi:hypothetical protein